MHEQGSGRCGLGFINGIEISVTSAAGSVWMGLFIHGLSSFPYSLGLSPRRLLAQFLSEQDGAAVPEG
jgi:hypothetical protein